MATRFRLVWNFVAHYKYLITIVVGVLIVGVLDENSFRQLVRYELQIAELREEIEMYKAQYEADSKQLRELRRDPKAIEKIARERYFMKADDEDIFVLSTDIPVAEDKEDYEGIN